MNKILKHQDGSSQEVEVVYEEFTREGGFNGKPIKIYDFPMAVVKIVGMDIEKPWSFRTVPMKFLILKQ